MSLEIPSNRVEAILHSKIDGTTYDKLPLSRVEALLMELDAGGGGGTTDYNQLKNIPTLNGKSIKGDLTSQDVGVEGDYDTTYDPDDEHIIISQDQLNKLFGV